MNKYGGLAAQECGDEAVGYIIWGFERGQEHLYGVLMMQAQ